jgi:hypothetical protein
LCQGLEGEKLSKDSRNANDAAELLEGSQTGSPCQRRRRCRDGCRESSWTYGVNADEIVIRIVYMRSVGPDRLYSTLKLKLRKSHAVVSCHGVYGRDLYELTLVHTGIQQIGGIPETPISTTSHRIAAVYLRSCVRRSWHMKIGVDSPALEHLRHGAACRRSGLCSGC